MTNQPPLNPDGVWNAMDTLMAETDTDERATVWAHNVTTRVLEGYLALAQPEVNSVEELDALPLESVVHDKHGYVYLLEDVDDEFKWSRNGLDAHFASWGIVLPARVLYRP